MQQAVELPETAAAPLGSFPAIFSQAMSLGLLSKAQSVPRGHAGAQE